MNKHQEWYQNIYMYASKLDHKSKLGGYVKMRNPLYTQIFVWVNTILSHNNIGLILPRYEGSWMIYRLEWYWKQNTVKCPNLIGIVECEVLIMDTQMVSKKRWYMTNFGSTETSIEWT